MLVAAEIDRELLEECRRGSQEAFRALFESYKDKVYSIALRYAGNHAASMDITQDVFVKLFTRIDRFRGDANFDSWLYRIVVNSCLDYRRKLRHLVPLLGDAIRRIRGRDHIAEDLVRSENRHWVQEAVAALSPQLRIVVVLRYTEDLSYDEIAETLHCSRGTVASRLNRAHKRLARRLAHLANGV